MMSRMLTKPDPLTLIKVEVVHDDTDHEKVAAKIRDALRRAGFRIVEMKITEAAP